MTDDLQTVLTLLYDRGDGFWSREELSERSGLSLECVAAAVAALGDRGFEMDCPPAQGVRLVRPTKLAACLIERDLGTDRIGRNVVCFDELDSTNDTAAESAPQAGADGLVVTAEYQRLGRGRHGRQWLAEPGTNLLASVLLLSGDGSPMHEALTIGAGLAVAEGLDEACGVACRLKWPNDVLIDGRKVAGVLVEGRGGPPACMIVGMGINANWSPPDESVDAPAVSLADAVGGDVERVDVLRSLLRRMEVWCARIAAGNLAAMHDAWLSRCGMMNQRITVRRGGRDHTGRVVDVSPLEGLVLAEDSGQCVHLPAEGSTIVD